MWYIALYGMFAVWVLLDGIARRIGPLVAAWTVGTFLLGPIVLPVYLAKRPLKKGEVREGGTAWNVLKNFAILWTALMAMAGFGAMMHIGQTVSSLDSDAARAGAGLGMLLGMGFLAVVWFLPTCGTAVLGFLLKKNSIVETGPTGALVGQDSPAGLANGWAGLLGSAVVAVVIVMAIARTGTQSVNSTAATSSGHHEVAPATWTVDEKVNAMDETKKTVLSLRSQDEVEGYIGHHAAFLIIKCEKGKSEAFVSVGTQIQHEYGSERYGVRVKFDDSNAVKQHWDASTDGTALFSPSPGELVRELEGTKVFLFEFTPFQKTPTIVTFNVSGLSEKLTPISGSCGLATTISQR
jgi:Type VI secretion system VasI, EvfG, VC_A0118